MTNENLTQIEELEPKIAPVANTVIDRPDHVKYIPQGNSGKIWC